MIRVACYIDGFNLYHAVDDLKKPHLKWVNLYALAQSFCRKDEHLVKVTYFSAYATWMPDRYARHRQFVAALEASGVVCHMARFTEKVMQCKTCGARWKSREEKETDVHFALAFLEDAIDDVFDRAIILSADSDYVPAIRRVRDRLPAKEVFLAIPPGRHNRARGMMSACHTNAPITPGRMEKCLLPEVVSEPDGRIVARRPQSYAPRDVR